MHVKSILAAGALLLATAGASTASATVVLSENFNGQGQTLNWGGNGNFTVTQGNVDLIGDGYFDFFPGNGGYLDLDGTGTLGSSPASTLTSNAVFGGGSYVLTFNLGGNSRTLPGRTTTITLGDWSTTITLQPYDGWTSQSFNIVTSGGALTFSENGPANYQGNILDNVSLSAVPEPATWAMMIIGFGAVGTMVRASRRRQAFAAA